MRLVQVANKLTIQFTAQLALILASVFTFPLYCSDIFSFFGVFWCLLEFGWVDIVKMLKGLEVVLGYFLLESVKFEKILIPCIIFWKDSNVFPEYDERLFFRLFCITQELLRTFSATLCLLFGKLSICALYFGWNITVSPKYDACRFFLIFGSSLSFEHVWFNFDEFLMIVPKSQLKNRSWSQKAISPFKSSNIQPNISSTTNNRAKKPPTLPSQLPLLFFIPQYSTHLLALVANNYRGVILPSLSVMSWYWHAAVYDGRNMEINK